MKNILSSTGLQTIKDACELRLSVFLEKYNGAANHTTLFHFYNDVRQKYKIPESKFTSEFLAPSQRPTFNIITLHTSKS